MRAWLFLTGLFCLVIPAQSQACGHIPLSSLQQTELPGQYTPSFSRDIESLLMSHELEKPESMADEFRKTDARFTGGYAKFPVFYTAITEFQGSGCATSHSTYTLQEIQYAIQKWITARPNSLTAHVAITQFLIDGAWKARGHGFSYQVTLQQARAYDDHLKVAEIYLKDIKPTDDPFIYSEYLVLSRSRESLELTYSSAVRDFPSHYEFYVSYADRLQEKWFGRPGERDAYVKSLLEPSASDDSKIAFTFVAGGTDDPDATVNDRLIFKNEAPAVKAAYMLKAKRYGLTSREWDKVVDAAARDKDDDLAIVTGSTTTHASNTAAGNLNTLKIGATTTGNAGLQQRERNGFSANHIVIRGLQIRPRRAAP